MPLGALAVLSWGLAFFGLVAFGEGGFSFLQGLAAAEFGAGFEDGVGDDLAGAAGAFGGWFVGCGAFGSDAHGGRGGDGVLVGAEEEKLPVVVFALMANAFLDVSKGEFARGVLMAVGEDGDDDVAGTVFLGEGSELCVRWRRW